MNREQQLYEIWRDNVKDSPLHAAELDSIRGNAEEIRDRFYRTLSFGTAGLRGILGLGTNRMNVYTVGQATQGLASYLTAQAKPGGTTKAAIAEANAVGAQAPKYVAKAAIAFDSREFSDIFAKEAAVIFAANGVKVYLYGELMPTPALSYAVRELGCDTGVVITASHNPAAYNGYKAYGPDGSQIGPETASAVTACIAETDMFTGVRRMDFDAALASGMIEYISEEFVQQYIDRVYQEAIDPGVCARASLKLVYTPLNGAGNRCVRTVLAKAGVTDITVVPEQEKPDGKFPTCEYPNPEEREALSLGLALSEKLGADMLLATDPDADRVAVAVKASRGYQILTGNEVGVLLLDYICTARKAHGTMPKNPVAVRSIVSTKLADAVAGEHGVEMVSVLTGFKFIGEVILGLEEKGEGGRYIFGFEESCGYLTGGYVRDKDAVDASLLLVEMASAYKLRGKTLADVLADIYTRHGIYKNAVESFAFAGADGMERMAAIMTGLRKSPPAAIDGDVVVAITDYKTSTRMAGGATAEVSLPKSDVLEYELTNGCTIIVRPSGTEPKLKVYYSLVADTAAGVQSLAERYSAYCAKLVK